MDHLLLFFVVDRGGPNGGLDCHTYEHHTCRPTEGLKSRLFHSYAEAKQNVHRGNGLLSGRRIAGDVVDVDFSLNWRPTSLFEATRSLNSAITSIPDCIILTTPNSTLVSPITFNDDNEVPSTQRGPKQPAHPAPLPSSSVIVIPQVTKKELNDHLPIFRGFRSIHICWLNDSNEWMILQRRYDGTETSGTRIPRNLGEVQSRDSRLELSMMSGNAFFTLEDDPFGTVRIWEFL